MECLLVLWRGKRVSPGGLVPLPGRSCVPGYCCGSPTREGTLGKGGTERRSALGQMPEAL